MTLPKPEELPLIKARAQARHDAMRELIRRHRSEYDQIHGDLREEHGLPRHPNSQNEAVLRERIQALEERLRNLGDTP